jgi:hypothetical protein
MGLLVCLAIVGFLNLGTSIFFVTRGKIPAALGWSIAAMWTFMYASAVARTM